MPMKRTEKGVRRARKGSSRVPKGPRPTSKKAARKRRPTKAKRVRLPRRRADEGKIAEVKARITALAAKYVQDSPLPDSARRTEAAAQLARTVTLAEDWYAREVLGDLPVEKSRQLGRLSAEIRKWLDDLHIKAVEEEPAGFMGALDR